MGKVNWSDAKTDYVTSDLSYRQIAEKYGVTLQVVQKRGMNEKWVDARNIFRTKRDAKISDRAIKKSVDRYDRLITLADTLADKIEQALTELDKQVTKYTQKTKTVEYKNKERPDKPTKEETTITEDLTVVDTIIDREGARLLAAALKDLKEVQGLKSKNDEREQNAKIAKLEKDADRDADEAKQITVRIESGGEWSQ